MILIDAGQNSRRCGECFYLLARPGDFVCRIFDAVLAEEQGRSARYPLRCKHCREGYERFNAMFENLHDVTLQRDKLREALKVATDALERRIEPHNDLCVIDTPKRWGLGDDGTCSGADLVVKLREVLES